MNWTRSRRTGWNSPNCYTGKTAVELNRALESPRKAPDAQVRHTGLAATVALAAHLDTRCDTRPGGAYGLRTRGTGNRGRAAAEGHKAAHSRHMKRRQSPTG